jgi:hypothetical protein
MKILLDECVPWPIHTVLTGHTCTTVQSRGWSGFKNGDLLNLAEAEFELFITADQNIKYQQNLSNRKISILQLSTNSLRKIIAEAGIMRSAIASIRPREYRNLQIP